MRKKTLGFAIALIASATSFFAWTTQAKIIGVNDLFLVSEDGTNVAAPYRPVLDAIGAIGFKGATSSEDTVCTGTHIGNGYVITAGHCFFPPAANRTEGLSVSNQDCKNVKVYWGYRGDPATAKANTITPCAHVLRAEYSLTEDYGIFKVDIPPPVKIQISPSNAPLTTGTPLTLFGHPLGETLKWSQTCAVLGQLGNFLQHDCDTQGGSSGSALLRLNASNTVEIVGIHSADAPSVFNDFNIASPMSEIRAALKKNNVDLDPLTF